MADHEPPMPERHDYRSRAAYEAWLALQPAALPPARPPAVQFDLVQPAPVAAAAVLDSVLAQTHPHWRAWWCPSGPPVVEPRLHPQAPDAGMAALLGQAVSRRGAQYVILLPPDAVLAPDALACLAAEIAACPFATILFSDEDRMDGQGRRHAPWFKPGFDPELMLGRNALGSLVAYEAGLLARAAAGLDPAAPMFAYALALRATSLTMASAIRHVPRVLCHRLEDPDAPPHWQPDAARAVLQAHLDEAHPGAAALPAPLAPHWSRVAWPVPAPAPLVSILIPTRDRAELLERAVDAVLARTDYPAIELLILDNDSTEPAATALLARLAEDPRVRVLPMPGPFNYAAMNNRGAAQARGELLLLLNNDTDTSDPGWLREMVGQALRPDIGAVGARLLYADGRVQHAGVVFNRDMQVIHALRLSGPEDPGPCGELALARSVSAVTGACLCLRRSVFQALGGLEEANLAVAFNDIDLCLRAGDQGYRIIATPFATLTHYESATRTPDTLDAQARDRVEHRWFFAHWRDVLARDPCRSPHVDYGWEGTSLAPPPLLPLPPQTDGRGPTEPQADAARLDRAAGRTWPLRAAVHAANREHMQARDELMALVSSPSWLAGRMLRRLGHALPGPIGRPLRRFVVDALYRMARVPPPDRGG